MSNEQCVHHWVVDEFNVGRCKNCPAVKDFDALMNKDKKVAQILHPARGGKRGRALGKSRPGLHLPNLLPKVAHGRK